MTRPGMLSLASDRVQVDAAMTGETARSRVDDPASDSVDAVAPAVRSRAASWSLTGVGRLHRRGWSLPALALLLVTSFLVVLPVLASAGDPRLPPGATRTPLTRAANPRRWTPGRLSKEDSPARPASPPSNEPIRSWPSSTHIDATIADGPIAKQAQKTVMDAHLSVRNETGSMFSSGRPPAGSLVCDDRSCCASGFQANVG